MKNIVLLFVIWCIPVLGVSQVEKSDIHSNHYFNSKDKFIKVNPLSVALFTINIKYEKMIHDNQSYQIGLAYTINPVFIETYYNGPSFTFSYRKYTKRKKRSVNYFEPFIRTQFFRFYIQTLPSNTDYGNLLTTGGGLNIGKVIRIFDSLYLDLFIGGQYQYAFTNVIKMETTSELQIPIILEGLSPNLGLHFTYRF